MIQLDPHSSFETSFLSSNSQTHLRKAISALAAMCTPNEVARAFCKSTADTFPAALPNLLPLPASLPNKLDFLLACLPACLSCGAPGV